MKKNLLLLLSICFIMVSCQKEKQHNGHPVINANSTGTKYKIAENWYDGWWSIAPQVKHDTLKVLCYSNPEKFIFKTDIDSISFDVSVGKSYDFYVNLKDSTYAHTIITGIDFPKDKIKYATTPQDTTFNILYEENKGNSYLSELAAKYPVQEFKKDITDTEKLLQILDWTNSRWKHNGNNSPSKSDPITILDEAKAGGNFPCFAYAIVLKAQLENAGFKSRTIYLKTKDAETRKSSPGHVATEVYVNSLNKWVFLDGQFNIMPSLNNVPLNAVEFQDALTNNYKDLKLKSLKKVSKRQYAEFVYDYLYYLDTSLDHRTRIGSNIEAHKIKDKTSIMLAPVGAPNLTKVNFWDLTIDYCLYTNSLNDFYAKPQ